MTNDEMKPNRFLKLHTGRKLFAAITGHLKKGGDVLICTYTRATKITPKHADVIKIGKSGSVYMQSGKRIDCIDFCGIRYI